MSCSKGLDWIWRAALCCVFAREWVSLRWLWSLCWFSILHSLLLLHYFPLVLFQGCDFSNFRRCHDPGLIFESGVLFQEYSLLTERLRQRTNRKPIYVDDEDGMEEEEWEEEVAAAAADEGGEEEDEEKEVLKMEQVWFAVEPSLLKELIMLRNVLNKLYRKIILKYKRIHRSFWSLRAPLVCRWVLLEVTVSKCWNAEWRLLQCLSPGRRFVVLWYLYSSVSSWLFGSTYEGCSTWQMELSQMRKFICFSKFCWAYCVKVTDT